MKKKRIKGIVFIDRDGVINRFPGRNKWVTRPKEFVFLKNSVSAIKALNRAGFVVFVVSNQAGVSKKVYSKKDLEQVTSKMILKVKKSGADIRKVLYCLHSEQDRCLCRKPKTGMIEKALKLIKCRSPLSKMYMIGDDLKKDIAMGKNARITTILVLSGRDRKADIKKSAILPDHICKDLWQASRLIISKN